MIGVVLRCPSCGTTQSHSGECDACSEGDVRYFCTNHSPGLWVDGPICRACGAKFGDAPPTRPPAIPRTPPPSPPARRRPPSETRARLPRRAEPPDSFPTPPPARDADRDEIPPVPSLAEAIVDMLEEGKRRRETFDEVPRREPVAPTSGSSFPVMGCLGRLLLFVLLLIALGIGALLTVFGGLY